LPFHEAGLNVIWTEDMQPYRTRKVGVLNGAHTTSVLAAYLSGINTVREMMEDDVFGRYVKMVVLSEIVPSLPMDKDEAEEFANAVMERFRNPFIHHELISISLNSVSKWKVRVLPTVKNYMQKFGNIPTLLSFSLAALIAFYKGDLRRGYQVSDDADVVDFFKQIWAQENMEDVVNAVLSKIEFWDENLTALKGLEESVASALNDILSSGVIEAVKKRIG